MKTARRVYPLASILFILVFSQLLVGCKQTSSPSGIQPGSITGAVQLWGNGEFPLPSAAGVTVSLDSSSYTTQTDSTGLWKIDNVAPGNYNVTVSKSGFGLCHAYGVTVEGPGTASVSPTMTFGIEPTAALALSNVAVTTDDTSNENMLTGGFSGGSDNSGYEDFGTIIFLDLNANVQPGDAHTLWTLPGANENSNQFTFSVASLHQAGIQSGTTVYISASQANFVSVWHPGGGISSGTYNDPINNCTRFISPGPRSNVVAVTIP
jgi:hypothetical protein